MIYLDHNATTIISEKAQYLMQELSKLPLNASSIHNYGRKARSIIENARMQIAKLLNISLGSYDIVFTASGTEANNLLIHNFHNADIFISSVEHASIYQWRYNQDNIKIVSVDQYGILNLEDLEWQLARSTNENKLVSTILANNETGVIQPISEIKNIAKKYQALLHSDIMQAVGKMQINLAELGLDFATISGHKFGGPVGGGALVCKKSHRLLPMIIGGKQEKGLRSGTENIIAIAGMGVAAEEVTKSLHQNIAVMLKLRNILENNLPSTWFVVSKDQPRLPNTSLIIANNFRADSILIALDLKGICISNGAACSSGKAQKSTVLQAMNMNDEQIRSAIRVSLSHVNTESEISIFNNLINEIYAKHKIKEYYE